MIVHRIKETINGREYLIEVSNVGADKWRAQIRRTPGGSCAMMPFYGATPAEAAAQLSRWLVIANGSPRREPLVAGLEPASTPRPALPPSREALRRDSPVALAEAVSAPHRRQ